MSLDDAERQVWEEVARRSDDLVALASELIRFDTTARMPGEPAREEAQLQELLAGRLRSAGAEVDLWEPSADEMAGRPLVPPGLDFDGRPQLVARFPGAGSGRRLMLNGHIDVVSGEPVDAWTSHPFRPEVRDRKLYGRGACDMKGGVACTVFAAEVLAGLGIHPHGDPLVATKTDEEASGARAPVGVIVSSEGDELVFVDYERHRTLVERVALFDDAIFYDYTTVIDQIRSAVRGRGWNGRAIGIERWTQAPGAPLVDEIAAALEAEGGHAVDGDWIVDRVRLVKSEAELECVRRAAEIVDAAFASLLEYVRPGRTELEIAAHLNAAMAALGGEEPAIRTMVSAGPDVWCRTHSPPSRRPVEAGDVMYVDACGVYNRYHVDLCRTFAIGRDHPDARRVLEGTAGSVEGVRAAVKPGDPLDVAQRVAEEYVYARFPREQVWWGGGAAGRGAG